MKQINEIKRMQQLAGIINENQLFEIDDQSIKQNINKLEDEDIHIVTKNLPTEYTDGNKEKVITGLLNIIQKVNPEADIEKKKISIERAFDETVDRIASASYKSFSVARGVKDYFEDNLEMFK